MSIVLDSSGWIELLADSGRADLFEPALEDPVLIVPTLVRYEVSRYALVNGGAAARVLALRAMAKFQSVDFSADLADRAVSLAHDHKLATADAIIYATALHHDAELWTQDAHFKGLAGVRYFGKTVK